MLQLLMPGCTRSHLSAQDIAALKAELSDPRFDTEYWRHQINLQLELGLKSEQQRWGWCDGSAGVQRVLHALIERDFGSPSGNGRDPGYIRFLCGDGIGAR